ncbi:hypothetical protein GKG47_14180 [Lactonifactor sp. BIOML-A3]|uniref:hypothetical protein n=1 Tax=unclassified Lactonifactor TaxID=2636670 RepID=UPI0012B0F7A4|nr:MULTISPECIES: hypothetical protein [unclassified Lactonifactor]MSA02931.1 hypothetical protein [Lactonifactor sp. BIOML-A5]MSA10239.1 hypothetical protein [Lactonifactor sp. BIOML-A4]MSA13578.1 hypothetical protein [Lactonifactor sp. BIOML-A3]MSA19212.1 hypothetical protein [Lactonifactor sp. BIOML-A2]MSA39132.1 hypothetical protein [Lactonifactor sp. BIOML-A1]
MRATCEIIADLKDGKEVSYEELKMACLVQSSIIFFYQQDTKALLQGGLSADLTKRMEYSDPETSSEKMGIPSWYWKAIKKDPMEWLGPSHIPGTEQWEVMHNIHKNVYKKATET